MAKCIECEFLKIDSHPEDEHEVRAMCTRTSSRGKNITWALYPEGKSRVMEILKLQKKSPVWCPLLRWEIQ